MQSAPLTFHCPALLQLPTMGRCLLFARGQPDAGKATGDQVFVWVMVPAPPTDGAYTMLSRFAFAAATDHGRASITFNPKTVKAEKKGDPDRHAGYFVQVSDRRAWYGVSSIRRLLSPHVLLLVPYRQSSTRANQTAPSVHLQIVALLGPDPSSESAAAASPPKMKKARLDVAASKPVEDEDEGEDYEGEGAVASYSRAPASSSSAPASASSASASASSASASSSSSAPGANMLGLKHLLREQLADVARNSLWDRGNLEVALDAWKTGEE